MHYSFSYINNNRRACRSIKATTYLAYPARTVVLLALVGIRRHKYLLLPADQGTREPLDQQLSNEEMPTSG